MGIIDEQMEWWDFLERHGLRIVQTHDEAMDEVLNGFVDRLIRLRGRFEVVLSASLVEHR
jgi:hypothetical protein